jgi:hypothetical protein
MSLRRRVGPLAVAGMTIAAVGGTAACGGGGERAGPAPPALYFETNAAPKNVVRVFFRLPQGRLKPGPEVETGGSGSGRNPPINLPVLDSQGALTLSPDRRLLFAVNAGSDSVSSFRVVAGGLERADEESARGDLPVSAAVARLTGGRLVLYVLDERSANVSGYTVDGGGNLEPIGGGVGRITDHDSAMVGFDRSGRILTVTNRRGDTISTFAVNGRSGRLGREYVEKATGTGDPFGFGYTRRNVLVVSNAGNPVILQSPSAPPPPNGSASTYRVGAELPAVTPVVARRTHVGSTCWVTFANGDRDAYMTGNRMIARVAVGADGTVAARGATPTRALPFDEATSPDGRYLYVLEGGLRPMPKPGPVVYGMGRIETFRIGADGRLTLVGSTIFGRFGGASGLVVR